jgi:endonuclease III
VDVGRRLHPERPGALDFPAWEIGRQWCDARAPRCDPCPLSGVCPRLVSLGP